MSDEKIRLFMWAYQNGDETATIFSLAKSEQEARHAVLGRIKSFTNPQPIKDAIAGRANVLNEGQCTIQRTPGEIVY